MSREEDISNFLNTIFIGEIAAVHNYGAFVKIPGNKSQGLIHRTQVSKVPVEDVSEILQRGEKVWCKVINITDDNKIGLSMKVVDQGNGKDLDPNGVQIHQDEQKRKAYVPGSGKKTIQLEAVLNTTCSKCGTHGHLARDCFKSPDGKTYELIPEDDPVETRQSLQNEEQQIDTKVKKQKKNKKKHKKEKDKKSRKHKKQKKERKSSSSTSEDSKDHSEEQQKQSSKKKKRRHSSSSDSDDQHKKAKH